MVTEATETTYAGTAETPFQTIAEVERTQITLALKLTGGNKTKAAKLLGVTLKTLYNKLNKYKAEATTATTTT
jgi:DNA-binding NtrC family response regulator